MNYGRVKPISANYSCSATDEILMANATAGAITVILPTLNVESGRRIQVFKTDASANAIGFAPPAGYTIESSLADATVNAKDDSIQLFLNGTIWYGETAAEALVKLQTTTPGTAQTGNSNVSGTAKAAQFSGGGAAVTGVDAATLGGQTFSDPGPIGDGTPDTGEFTTVDAATSYSVATVKLLGAQAAAIADVVGAGVTSPANAIYTQADQTALADAVLELKAQVNNLLAKLRTHGVIAT